MLLALLLAVDLYQLDFKFPGDRFPGQGQFLQTGSETEIEVVRYEPYCPEGGPNWNLHGGCPGGGSRKVVLTVVAARCEPAGRCTTRVERSRVVLKGLTPGETKLVVNARTDHGMRLEGVTWVTIQSPPDDLVLEPDYPRGYRLPVGTQIPLYARPLSGGSGVAPPVVVTASDRVRLDVIPQVTSGTRVSITGVAPGPAEVRLSVQGLSRSLALEVIPATKSALIVSLCSGASCVPMTGEVFCHPGDKVQFEAQTLDLQGRPVNLYATQIGIYAVDRRLDVQFVRSDSRLRTASCPDAGSFEVTLAVQGEGKTVRRITVVPAKVKIEIQQ